MKTTVLTLTALLLAPLSLHAADPIKPAPRPNIILFMTDDQGWGETGYNGHPYVKTPVLDEMSKSGLRLDRFYAAAPVCSPTRASVMTGRHPNRSGVFSFNYSTRPEEITLPQILQKAGYHTGHFGKWHLGAVKKESPLNPGRMGADEYLAHDNFFEMDPPLSRNGAPPEIIKGEGSEIIVNEALAFIRKVHAEKKPFFVVIWTASPHGPYSGLDKDVALYSAVPQEEMRRRFAEITAMDRSVGTLRAALRELGLADNTLLWFNSDNGIPPRIDSFNGVFRGAKGSLDEGGLRVPALIEWPAVIKAPRTTDVPCVTTDILPTVLDLTGLKYPDPKRPLDGISLRPLLVDGTMKERPSPIGFWKYDAKTEKDNPRWVDAELSRGTTPTTKEANIDFLNYRHPVAKTEDFGGAAVWMDNRYKLSTWGDAGKRRVSLFDVQADPGEKTNIAAQHPDVVQRMTEQLHAWQHSVEQSLTGADY